jgi:hypothetical protein
MTSHSVGEVSSATLIKIFSWVGCSTKYRVFHLSSLDLNRESWANLDKVRGMPAFFYQMQKLFVSLIHSLLLLGLYCIPELQKNVPSIVLCWLNAYDLVIHGWIKVLYLPLDFSSAPIAI